VRLQQRFAPLGDPDVEAIAGEGPAGELGLVFPVEENVLPGLDRKRSGARLNVHRPAAGDDRGAAARIEVDPRQGARGHVDRRVGSVHAKSAIVGEGSGLDGDGALEERQSGLGGLGSLFSGQSVEAQAGLARDLNAVPVRELDLGASPLVGDELILLRDGKVDLDIRPPVPVGEHGSGAFDGRHVGIAGSAAAILS